MDKYMYKERISLNNITVIELIAQLAKLDPKASISICGSDEFYIHINDEYVTLDHDELGDCYDENYTEPMSKERKIILLYEILNSFYECSEYDIMRDDLKETGANETFTDEEINSLINSLNIYNNCNK